MRSRRFARRDEAPPAHGIPLHQLRPAHLQRGQAVPLPPEVRGGESLNDTWEHAMHAWGEYGDVLRLIGRFLDDEHARQETGDPSPIGAAPPTATERVDILNLGGSITLSWQLRSGSGRRSLREADVRNMRGQARRLRTGAAHHSAGEREELFRTFGQLLEIQGSEIDRIVETVGRLTATGAVRGEPFHEGHSQDELRTVSELRRLLREPAPKLRATAAGDDGTRPLAA
jgi:hypothetical protein